MCSSFTQVPYLSHPLCLQLPNSFYYCYSYKDFFTWYVLKIILFGTYKTTIRWFLTNLWPYWWQIIKQSTCCVCGNTLYMHIVVGSNSSSEYYNLLSRITWDFIQLFLHYIHVLLLPSIIIPPLVLSYSVVQRSEKLRFGCFELVQKHWKHSLGSILT